MTDENKCPHVGRVEFPEFWKQDKADQLVPRHIQGGLKRWITQGIEPGSFLQAVLENDLREAMGRADHINVQALPEIVAFLYNYAPGGCWGSEEKYEKWRAWFVDARKKVEDA